MGDKIEVEKLARAAGVTTVPGHLGMIADARARGARSPATSAIR